jgi:hypothetical protein
MNEDTSNIERSQVVFCERVTVDGYRLPDGSFWVSITTASEAVGYSRVWLSQNISRGANTFKALVKQGFSQNILKLQTPSAGGPQTNKLISLEDFNTLILYATFKGKKEAIALNKALVATSLQDFFRAAFGERPLTIEEKRRIFYKEFAASLSREDWLQMDREDVALIEEQEKFLEGD